MGLGTRCFGWSISWDQIIKDYGLRGVLWKLFPKLKNRKLSLITVFGSINVTKSIEIYPIILRSLQAWLIVNTDLLMTSLSIDVCGNVCPQHLYGEVECNYKKKKKKLITSNLRKFAVIFLKNSPWIPTRCLIFTYVYLFSGIFSKFSKTYPVNTPGRFYVYKTSRTS